ncbi:class I SAM-dependent methyltransferase [Hazenella sp. IB182357]|uniref:Uncharacterized methyltransferase IC620_14660 n=1 Tax=Polycladospora coralii TaxID=2771432 RepID=A0A926NC79_9BACL|nr:class I SAM-dependent methyltransferase [Polycladospora coralii]MBD1373587.1 class I SAM-dependent methyltransferase [Polycladospora coralii]MBS7531957.1 class I SAM-dependent methyltransferase [Polycladospora coralii]
MSYQPRFNHIFEEWASNYDQEITGGNPQYAEAFEGYDQILNEVADALVAPFAGTILELGVGTGNLSKVIRSRGLHVLGVEPSPDMRAIASTKIPEMKILDGHFLSLPEDATHFDGIVSTYAFHHLTDEEKDMALVDLAQRLKPNGKIVFADSIFLDQAAKQAMIDEARERQFYDLATDLEREYYPILPRLEHSFKQAGLKVTFKQMNRFVWLMVAEIA